MSYLNNYTDEQVDKVLLVCPDVSKDDIRRDLSFTSNAEETINRIFDGNFLEGVVQTTRENNSHPVNVSDDEDDDDDNDLPEINLHHQLSSNYSFKRNFAESENDATKSAKLSKKIDDFDQDCSQMIPPKYATDYVNHLSNQHNTAPFNSSKQTDTPSKIIDLTQTSHPLTMNEFDDEIDHRGSPISLSSSDNEGDNTISLLNRIRGIGSKVTDNNHELKNEFNDNDLDVESVIRKKSYETNFESQETNASVSSTISSVSCDSSSSTTSRKNRTPEEIAEHKRLALERKAQKERERLEKKSVKAKQLAQRKALQELKKSSRPEQCMKYITAVIDPILLEGSGGGEVLAKLQTLDCKTELSTQPIPNSISWKRDNIEHHLGEDLQVQSCTRQTDEEDVLIVIPTCEFVEMISSYKKEQCTGYYGDEHLQSFAQKSKRAFPGKTINMVTIAMEKYFRHQKTLQNRNFRAACLGTDVTQPSRKKKTKKVEDITTSVTRLEVEEALVDLQLQEGCVLKLIETPVELGDLVAMYTKAVAETPFKRERDQATFSFHVDTEWAGGVKIGKDGKGLLRLWRQQIQQFRNVSPEIAQAVVAEYPSPQLLLKAYNQCTTSKEAETLLQDIMVRRGTGVLSRSRRVGKELSRRIYIQMTSRDSEQLLH